MTAPSSRRPSLVRPCPPSCSATRASKATRDGPPKKAPHLTPDQSALAIVLKPSQRVLIGECSVAGVDGRRQLDLELGRVVEMSGPL